MMAKLRHEHHALLVGIEVCLNDGRHVRGCEAETILQIMISLCESAGLFHLQNSGACDSPVCLEVSSHLFICEVFALDVPYDIVFLNFFSVNEECSRTDLREENASVIWEPHLELESGDISVLIFDISESYRLNDLFFHNYYLLEPVLSHQADS